MTRPCCQDVITRYENVDPVMTETAKARGGVALFCPSCQGRVVFADGVWETQGGKA